MLEEMVSYIGDYMDPIVFKGSAGIKTVDLKVALIKILGVDYSKDKNFTRSMVKFIKDNWLTSNWFVSAEAIVIWKYNKLQGERLLLEHKPGEIIDISQGVNSLDIQKLIKG